MEHLPDCRRLVRLAAVASRGVLALSLALTGAIPRAAEGPAWERKIHPLVLQAAAEGPVEFMLFLADQKHPLPPANARTRVERTRAVFRQLRDHADRTQAPLVALLERLGVEYRRYWIANLIWVRGDREALERLARRPEVLRIDANPRVRVELPQPDAGSTAEKSTAAVEWNLSQVDADAVWALGYLGQGVVVGGQDTGYEWDHPALIRQYRGWDGLNAVHDYNWHDAIDSSSGLCPARGVVPCDDEGHGTHTMGTMVGDDGGTNRIGMAPQARWIGCRNMYLGIGTPASYAECFQWFVAPTNLNDENPDPDLSPDVINNSWTCPSVEGCSQDTLRTVVENTRAAGIVVVVSAGNSGPGCSTISTPPSHYAASFSVGATTSTDLIATFSGRGPVTVDGSGRMKPDVTAPGVGVRSSYPTATYASASGTSMAGPHVAGMVALLLSARPDLKGRVADIETLIRSSAVPLTTTDGCGGDTPSSVPNNTYGHGRIDALDLLYADADGDGVSNLEDCSPVEARLWSAPSPARSLLLSKDGGGTLTWLPPSDLGAPTVSYDVVRSTLATDFSGGTCVASLLRDTTTVDPTEPVGAFYYLIRATNSCGDTMGFSSADEPRNGPPCP